MVSPTLLLSLFVVHGLAAPQDSFACQPSTRTSSSMPAGDRMGEADLRTIDDVDVGTFIQVAVRSQVVSSSNVVTDQHSKTIKVPGLHQRQNHSVGVDAERHEALARVSALAFNSVHRDHNGTITSSGDPLAHDAPLHAWMQVVVDSLPNVPGLVGADRSFANRGLREWDAFDTVLILSVLVVLVLFDIFVVPQFEYSIRNHIVILIFMLTSSAAFCICVWVQRGQAEGLAWATGYVVEWALSLDNLFVFHLVFKAFSVPNAQSIRALSVGIYGAVCFRVVFIIFLTKLFEFSSFVEIIVGIVLIMSGIYSLTDDEDVEVHDLHTVRLFKWMFGSRLQDKHNEEGSFFIRNEEGTLQMTVLFLVVCVISVVDVVFAVDSVGSKTGQIKNVYINLSSCLMAMFSLRSMFFIVRDMAEYFEYVKYGICAILCFVGIEMIGSRWFPVPLGVTCFIISAIFVTSVVASVVKVVKDMPSEGAEDAMEDAPKIPTTAKIAG